MSTGDQGGSRIPVDFQLVDHLIDEKSMQDGHGHLQAPVSPVFGNREMRRA